MEIRLIYKIALVVLGLISTNMATYANTEDIILNVHEKQEFTKNYSEQFPITLDGKVRLHNRYGKVEVKTWDKPEVSVKVTITVNAKDEATAQAEFDRISIRMDNTASLVDVETIIEAKRERSWFGLVVDVSTGGDYRIDYDIMMPQTANIDLYNKYGNSMVDGIGGDANFEIKYGNINTKEIGGNMDLMLGYGNATILGAKYSDVTVKYSNISIGKTGDINIDSKYSKVNVDQADAIKINSKYDTYAIGKIRKYTNMGKYNSIDIEEVEEITVDTRYSDYQIEHLKGRGTFDMEYGGVRINKLAPNFGDLSLKGRYTNCKIFIDCEKTPYRLDAQGRYASMRLPDNLNIIKQIEDGSTKELEAINGDKNTTNKITVRLNYGGIKID